MPDLIVISNPIVVLVLALIGVVVSGRLTIRFLTNITTAFGVSEFTVAFVILALATSMPEVFVGITSSLRGASDLIISTALGSNIVNATLITGLTALLSGGISTEQLHLKRDLSVGGIISFLPLLFLLNGTVSRFEGLMLLLVFLMYLALLAHDQLQYRSFQMPSHLLRGLFSVVLALAAIGLLLYSSDKTVASSVELAALVGIPSFLIGLFLLSLGTSLPELVTTLQANRRGKSAMALGNIIGSNITNSSLVIGIAALIHPISVSLHRTMITTMVSVVVASVLLAYLAARREKLSIGDGLRLLSAFILFGIAILIASGGSY